MSQIDPLELLYNLTDWCVDHPNWKEIKRYELNKLIAKSTIQRDDLDE